MSRGIQSRPEMRHFLFFLCLLGLIACSAPPTNTDLMNQKSVKDFDWQGHRGARGLLPENTVPAFLKALEYPQVTTLELDLAVSQDNRLVVSHEPWMSHHICSHPDGRPVQEDEEMDLLIYQMPYSRVELYDCGMRGNDRFAEQEPVAAHKPTLEEVVTAAERYVHTSKRSPIQYNIEIKSQPDYDGIKCPPPTEFARLLYNNLRALGVTERACVQSFDVRPLQAFHALDSTITTALLIENTKGVAENLELLGYTPSIYSPYYKLITANTVEEVHKRGVRLIPWTVNEVSDMQALIQLGVDGIITDYPNRIEEVKK